MVELENAIFMVTITTTRKEVSKNKLNTKTKIITMITQIKHCGYHGLQCFQVYQLCFAKMVIIFVKGPINLPMRDSQVLQETFDSKSYKFYALPKYTQHVF